jgi:serine/threonine protein kinase
MDDRPTCPRCGARLARGAASLDLCPSCLFTEALRGDPEDEGPAIDERYAFVNVLGEGRHGTTYLAHTRQSPETPVAVKILHARRPHAEWRSRLQTYVMTVTAVNHAGIARVVDAGVEPDGRAYVVTDFVLGRRILTHCVRSRLAVRERLRLFADMCSAIDAAHSRGLVHGHVVPENVLVSAHSGGSVARVLDFALNALLEDARLGPADDGRAMAQLLEQLLASKGPAGDGLAWSDSRARIVRTISGCRTAEAMAVAAEALAAEQRA